MNTLNVWLAGKVRRFHTHPMIGVQTVAAHSWGVAWIIATYHPNPSADLLKAALVHDLAEKVTGDVPATAKWRYPAVKSAMDQAELSAADEMGFKFPELSPLENMWLKAADMLELTFEVWSEVKMGNSYAMEIFENCLEWAECGVNIPVQLQHMFKREFYQ